VYHRVLPARSLHPCHKELQVSFLHKSHRKLRAPIQVSAPVRNLLLCRQELQARIQIPTLVKTFICALETPNNRLSELPSRTPNLLCRRKLQATVLRRFHQNFKFQPQFEAFICSVNNSEKPTFAGSIDSKLQSKFQPQFITFCAVASSKQLFVAGPIEY
jgi:hypothetical protein